MSEVCSMVTWVSLTWAVAVTLWRLAATGARLYVRLQELRLREVRSRKK